MQIFHKMKYDLKLTFMFKISLFRYFFYIKANPIETFMHDNIIKMNFFHNIKFGQIHIYYEKKSNDLNFGSHLSIFLYYE